MGIGNNADFVTRILDRQKEKAEKKLDAIKESEILARHELSSPAYAYGGFEKRKKIRARVMTLKLTRWV